MRIDISIIKKLFLLSSIVLIVYSGQSQNTFIPETGFGIKLGGDMSLVRFDPTISQDMNFGFVGGLSFNHIQEKNLGIQVEIDFMQAGWVEKLDSNKTYSRRLNYLQLPLLSHFIFGKKHTRFFVNFGPYLSFLISEKETIKGIDIDDENNYYGHNIDNPLEFGLCLGFGIAQYTSIGKFQLEIRGNFSLSNIFRVDNQYDFTSSKNFITEASLTYLIDYNLFRKLISGNN